MGSIPSTGGVNFTERTAGRPGPRLVEILTALAPVRFAILAAPELHDRLTDLSDRRTATHREARLAHPRRAAVDDVQPEERPELGDVREVVEVAGPGE